MHWQPIECMHDFHIVAILAFICHHVLTVTSSAQQSFVCFVTSFFAAIKKFCAPLWACTVVVWFPLGQWGTFAWRPSPGRWQGTVFRGLGKDMGGGELLVEAFSKILHKHGGHTKQWATRACLGQLYFY